VVGGGGQVAKELGGRDMQGSDVCNERERVGAEVGGPRVAEEGVDLPARGSGWRRKDVGGGDSDEEPGVIRPDRVLKGDRALRRVGRVGEECLVDEDVINEGGACTRSSVGDGTLQDGGDQSRSIKPLLQLVVPARGGNVRGRPEGGVGIKISAE